MKRASRRIVGYTLGAILWLVLATLLMGWGDRPTARAQEPTGRVSPSATRLATVDPALRLKIEPALFKRLSEGQAGRVPILVEMKAAARLGALTAEPDVTRRRQALIAALQQTAQESQGRAWALLSERARSGAASQPRSLWINNTLAAEADRDTILALAGLPEVRLVRRDREFRISDGLPHVLTAAPLPQGVEPNLRQIGADRVWSALRLDGSGVVVANVDTGVDWLHPALQASYRGYSRRGLHQHACNWFDATGAGAAYPVDTNGHGTQTMGVIVGAGGIGVAPGARWIAVRAFNSQGAALESWLHTAMQWLLAPGPGCTPPDIVNSSWANPYGGVDVFRPDVQALRAAGIFAPFAAGNTGPTYASIGAPAAYPEAFSVGAVAADDILASFSGRGPSGWYGGPFVKPEISAPGVGIRSSLPGGGYGQSNGTSLAVPHVAGTAALMLQANPALTLTQLEDILKRSALPMGSPVPNNDYGWGRLDAYAAVARVAQVGSVVGVVRRAADGLPLAGARLTATPLSGGSPTGVVSDADGRYTLALAPGGYQLTASAFGYAPHSEAIQIVGLATLTKDMTLLALPTGTLAGRVTSRGQPIPASGYRLYLPMVARNLPAGSGGASTTAPAKGRRSSAVTIRVSDTPLSTVPDAQGFFRIQLPIGSYTLTVSSPGYRVEIASGLQVQAAQTTTHNFDLTPAPTILLVDSGAWYYGSQIAAYQQALDDLRYTYDTWTIADPKNQVPTARDLLGYDVVFWSAPEDSPGYLGASQVLTTYLESGGALFLSGQDVAYYDDSLPATQAPYYREYLKAGFEKDDAASRHLTGNPGGLFEGLELTISGSGGADNQLSPDVIHTLDSETVPSLLTYAGDGSGGQRASLCLPYRAIVLSFGLEAVTSRAARAELIGRVMTWFSAPPESAGLQMKPGDAWPVGNFGASVTHSLQLRHAAPGSAANNFTLTASGFRWPTTMLEPSLRLTPCSWVTSSYVVRVPSDATWADSDVATIIARSDSLPGLQASITQTTYAPAPVLLVDDDRWYDVETHYQAALSAAGVPFNTWQVPWDSTDGRPVSGPPLDVLRMYPMVIWFSASDWAQPLTAEEEARLTSYLQSGGRLYYNGQDYLYHSRGPTDFARRYLGVYTYTEDFSSTLVTGVITHPLSSGLGPEALNYPYENFSDALTPTTSARVAFVGQEGQAAALTNAGDNWRTAFFAFDPDGLSAPTQARLMSRLTGWLSWIGASDVQVDKELARQGETLTYTVSVRNDGWQSIAAYLTATMNADLQPVVDSLQAGLRWDPAQSAVVWSGTLAQGQQGTFRYQARLADPLPKGYLVSHALRFGYANHQITFERSARTGVNMPVFDRSTFSSLPALARYGAPLTYTLQVYNSGIAESSLTATNVLPAELALVGSSLQAEKGTTLLGDRVITWQLPVLNIGESARLTYTALVSAVPADMVVRNRALLDDGLGHLYPLEAHTRLEAAPLYWPMIMRRPDH